MNTPSARKLIPLRASISGHPENCNCHDCALRMAHHNAERALQHVALGNVEEAGFYAKKCFSYSRIVAQKALPFVAIERTIMRGQEHIATAMSRSFAKRIASALNMYKPTRGGH